MSELGLKSARIGNIYLSIFSGRPTIFPLIGLVHTCDSGPVSWRKIPKILFTPKTSKKFLDFFSKISLKNRPIWQRYTDTLRATWILDYFPVDLREPSKSHGYTSPTPEIVPSYADGSALRLLVSGLQLFNATIRQTPFSFLN
jgi:hypothetical protein